MIDNTRARAHVNWGRWVATCPNRDCNNAEEIHPWPGYPCGHSMCTVSEYPERVFHCSLCRAVASIEWPSNAAELWMELGNRPRMETRNWYPAGHEHAAQWSLPHGQTVRDLAAEHAERAV